MKIVDTFKAWYGERQLTEHPLPSGREVRVRRSEAWIATIAFEAGEEASALLVFNNQSARTNVLEAVDQRGINPVLSRNATQLINLCIDEGRAFYEATESMEATVK